MTKNTIRSRDVQSRSLNFHVLEAGEDRPGEDPVILLHGYPQTSHMWRHQMPVLGERFKVYAPDTRGYGGTDKPRTRLDRSILARDIIDLMDALDIESARIVGHDWGGIIASAAALKYPDRFSRLGLIDTLVSVWITWGIHGYWFKCEPDAEDFFKKHHRDFIRSTLGGEDTPYGGPPESPWAPVEGSEGSAALADWDPTQFWTQKMLSTTKMLSRIPARGSTRSSTTAIACHSTFRRRMRQPRVACASIFDQIRRSLLCGITKA